MDPLPGATCPGTVPAVAQMVNEGLDLKAATVFVGEHGSGMSTLVEGIPMAFLGSLLSGARPVRHAQQVTDDQKHPESGSRGERLRVGLFSAFAVAYGSWLVLGVIDNLVWMPQLIAPSTPLGQIYAVLTQAGSAPGVAIAPVLWFLFWGTAGLAYLVVFLPAHRVFRRVAASMSALRVLGIGFALFGVMAFFEWISGFGMGMEVSDELPPYVGDTTPFGLFCFTGGALIALIGGALWLIGTLRPGRSPVATDA